MDIASIIAPVFGIALLGWVLTAAGVFRVSDIAGLTRYVFNFALPVMLFDSMSSLALPETIRWSFMVAYYLPVLVLYGAGALIARSVFGYGRAERGVFGMAGSYSNTVLIGLPVVAAAWGDAALLPLMMLIAVHSAILFSLTTILAESDATSDRARRRDIILRTLRGMARNPIVGGLVIGLAVNVSGLQIPVVLRTTTGLIRASAVPAALFLTGASLREYRVMGHVSESIVLIVFKMVVHPALVALLAYRVFTLPPLWAAVAVFTAALPTGINASVFARKYDAAVAPVVTATLLTTLLSIVTLSVLLVWIGPVGG